MEGRPTAYPDTDTIFCTSCGRKMQREKETLVTGAKTRRQSWRLKRQRIIAYIRWIRINKCEWCKAKKKKGGIHLEDTKYCRRCGQKYTFAAFAEFLSSRSPLKPEENTAENVIRVWGRCTLCPGCGYNCGYYPYYLFSRNEIGKDEADRVIAVVEEKILRKAEIKKSFRRPLSLKELEEMLRNAYGVSLEEFVEKNMLRLSLATLSPREEQILRMRYGIGGEATFTLKEIAQRFGVNRERVRQIERKALEKMLDLTRIREIDAYMNSLLKPA